MIDFWDAIKRAETGPFCSERQFDIELLPKRVRELVKEYDIRYDRDNPIPSDDSLADRIYQAGMELFLDLGVLCVDTERIIKFDEAEVKEALRNVPREINLGEGKDTAIMVDRGIEDKRAPEIHGGAFAVPVSEDIWLPLHQSYAMEPLIDTLGCGSLSVIEDVEAKTDSPLSMKIARAKARWAREALRKVGRPGLSISASNYRDIAETYASSPDEGMRKCDLRSVAHLSELKTNYNALCKTAHFLDYVPNMVTSLFVVLLGGYAGGPEGCTIVGAASFLQALLVHNAAHHLMGVHHLRYLCRTARENFWVWSVLGQAMSRNTHLIKSASLNAAAAGPCTEMLLYEVAAYACANTPSGWNLAGVGSAGGALLDHVSPIEVRTMAEVGNASTGFRRAEANEIVKKLLEKYEQKLSDPPRGKRWQDCYNLKTLQPTREWDNIYSRVKKELADLGFNFR